MGLEQCADNQLIASRGIHSNANAQPDSAIRAQPDTDPPADTRLRPCHGAYPPMDVVPDADQKLDCCFTAMTGNGNLARIRQMPATPHQSARGHSLSGGVWLADRLCQLYPYSEQAATRHGGTGYPDHAGIRPAAGQPAEPRGCGPQCPGGHCGDHESTDHLFLGTPAQACRDTALTPNSDAGAQ